VRVDYELSPLGTSLLVPIQHMKEWAESHMVEVSAAQVGYDDAREAMEVRA
jgi:DNA-binding HxlR family transcriptional regulator